MMSGTNLSNPYENHSQTSQSQLAGGMLARPVNDEKQTKSAAQAVLVCDGGPSAPPAEQASPVAEPDSEHKTTQELRHKTESKVLGDR